MVHARIQAVQRRKEELYAAGMKQDKLRPLIAPQLDQLQLEQQKLLVCPKSGDTRFHCVLPLWLSVYGRPCMLTAKGVGSGETLMLRKHLDASLIGSSHTVAIARTHPLFEDIFAGRYATSLVSFVICEIKQIGLRECST